MLDKGLMKGKVMHRSDRILFAVNMAGGILLALICESEAESSR